MRRIALTIAAFLVCGLLSPATLPAADPWHAATSTHSFEDVDHWTAVFDDPGRDEWQKPAELVAALGLKPGARVADLGAGTGYLEGYLSKTVGPEGTVLAIDTETALVQHLRNRAEKENLRNVTPILASTDDARIPRGSVDLVLILDTFHHISDRLTYARDLEAALRPGGRIAIIDWQKRELPVGPEAPHKLPRGHVLEEMQQAGYELVEEPDVLPYQYFLIFQQTAGAM
ncbi:MAG: methyltransferase domain-containing protein [Candidatus Binatia bacterium]|nr:methyltransferase domain-containing protein [Candidatus Binatia bacterium]